jgi:hypothetical protein
MAHNLFNERFFSLREKPWHSLGTVSEVERSAVEIFNMITPYVVTLEKVFSEVAGSKFELPNQVIVRHPVPDDPSFRTFGVVGPDYTLIDPLRTCEIWDESVTKPVETLGVLAQGESLFITTKLPTFGVAGDEVENYLLLHSPYGNGAIQVRITPVRVVCQNTLIAAKAQSTESFRIIHDMNVEKHLTKWLSGIVERAERKAKGLEDIFNLMASVQVAEDADVDQIMSQVYVDPALPRYTPDPDIFEKREAAYVAALRRIDNNKLRVVECWQGAGTGMDLASTQGTAWGLYNAVVEVEDYRPSAGWAAPEATAHSVLFGERASAKERAFSAVYSYANENYS